MKNMRTNKNHFLTAPLLGLMLAALFVGGCKKEFSSSGTVTKPDITMSTEGALGKIEPLRVSPSGDLIITMKSPSVKRVFPDLQAKEKITAELRESKKKKKAEGMTTSNVSFTATNQGTYYACYGEVPSTGLPHDWYLIDWYTNVYTYIGTSGDNTINFYVDKPSLYGQYRLWAEGPGGGSFTGYQYLGEPYTGVTISSGILSFTDQAAYDAVETRLLNAYEAHQTFIDNYDNLSYDATDAALISAGFDEFLPYKRFESHFGISSLRAQIQSENDYWYTQSHSDMSTFPDNDYVGYSYEQQTLMNTEGKFDMGEGTITLPTTVAFGGWPDPQNPGSNSCVFQGQKNGHEDYGDDRTVRKKVLVVKLDNATKFIGNSQTFKLRTYGLITPSVQKQRTKVYGGYYNGSCVYQNTFDSGLTNSGDKKRFSQRVAEKRAVAMLASKSGEFSMAVTISSHSTTPFVQTYTH
ncbi:hypothetical protein [Daejeonella sp.]|uniref:hypothetical protein n=1 Tax=Daejeonella sp. TaxID=2805397 RepID=UPI0030BAD564